MCVRFPWWLSSEESTYNAGDHPVMQGTRVQSLGQEDPLEKEMAKSTPVLVPGKSHGQRSLVGYSPWGHKESDTTERLHFPYRY